MIDPHFKEEIIRLVQDVMRQDRAPSYAIITSFYEDSNTASIVAVQPGSQEMGKRYDNVPCPYYAGVQTTAPEPGRMCWIAFPPGTKIEPVIVSYFSPNFSVHDYNKHYDAESELPSFLMDL